MMTNISYSREAFKDMDNLIFRFERDLREANIKPFDTIVGTGLSGALVVPTLARATESYFAIVRKPTDSSHSNAPFEGTIGDRWVFVDDFISTGATLVRVVNTIKDASAQYGGAPTTFVGAWEYQRAVGFQPANGTAIRERLVNGRYYL
jgi:orotate phosphoribosyltransferase